MKRLLEESTTYAELLGLLRQDLGLDARVQQGLVPIGVYVNYAAVLPVPPGYLRSNAGAAVSRSIYAILFRAIGTTYGIGDGSTTFNLPNIANTIIRAE